jgi:hypothetical protein
MRILALAIFAIGTVSVDVIAASTEGGCSGASSSSFAFMSTALISNSLFPPLQFADC